MQIFANYSNNENPTSSSTHPQYRQISALINICVLLVGLFDYLTGRAPSSPLLLEPTTRLLIFCVLLIIICGLEVFYQQRQTQKFIHSVIHLILVTVLSGIVLTVSNPNYSQLLLLTPILFSALTFSIWVSTLTSLTTFMCFFLRIAYDEGNNFLSIIETQKLLGFTVMMLIIWLMASLIEKEWTNRLKLQNLNNELKRTSTQLAQMAVLNERNRMARDIHDSVGHHLTAVSIQLEMATKLQSHDPEASASAIREAQSATREALYDVRQSVGALQKSNDSSFEIIAEVKSLVHRFSSENLEINCQLAGDETLYPKPVHVVVLRAVQEGLTNVHKHAKAAHVNLWLQFLPEQAHLRIIDDGSGYDSELSTYGTGLRGLRERVDAFGGTLKIESRLNEGTILDIVLPQSSL